MNPKAFLAELPLAKRVLGGKGYDADWLRNKLKAHSGLGFGRRLVQSVGTIFGNLPT